jgi:hypothetical protein
MQLILLSVAKFKYLDTQLTNQIALTRKLRADWTREMPSGI